MQYPINGDQHHDPTWPVTMHSRGGHPKPGPFSGAIAKGQGWAIEPVWTWADGKSVRLAAVCEPVLRLESARFSADEIAFTVEGEFGPHAFSESITLCDGMVKVLDRYQAPQPETLAVTFPVLVTDGRTETAFTITNVRAELRRPDASAVAVEAVQPQEVSRIRSSLRLDPPNGVVEPLLIQTKSDSIFVSIIPLPRMNHAHLP